MLTRRSNDMTVVKSKEIIFRVPVFFSKYINIKIEMNLCCGQTAKLKDLFPSERDGGLKAQLYSEFSHFF